MSVYDSLPLSERLRIAGEPTTPPNELEALFRDCLQGAGYQEEQRNSDTILPLLAGNPNTPPSLLVRLACMYAPAFCANPAAPLLCLEHPDFAARLDPFQMATLLRQPNVPPSLIASLVASPPALYACPEEPSLHIAIAGEAGADWQEEVKPVLCRLRNRSSKKRGSGKSEDEVLRQMAADGIAPLWLLDEDEILELPPPSEGKKSRHFQRYLSNLPQTPLINGFALAHMNLADSESAVDVASAWPERWGLALNPGILQHGRLKGLLEDGNRYVRAAARAHQADPSRDWRNL